MKARRSAYKVLFDPLGLASSLGEDAQEAMADRLGDATDPIHDSHYEAQEREFTKRYERKQIKGPKP